MTHQTVIVTGASGFIGTRLVRKLRERGDTIRALDILPPRVRLDGVAYHDVDVRKPIPAELGAGVDVTYNLAAVHRTPGHPPHEYYDTNLFGALSVTALAAANDIRTIVFTSSISVYGPSEEYLDEESALIPVSDYGRSKRMAELIHERWLEAGEDRNLVVVRPGVVFGPGERGNYSNLARALKQGYFVYPGRRDAIESGGYVDELIQTFDFAISRGERKVLYNFAYPDPSTTEDIVKTFGAVSGWRRRPLTIPTGLMLMAAGGFEIFAVVGIKTPIHRQRITKLVQSTKIAPSWLLKSGYPFSTRLQTALEHWRDETEGSFA